MVPFIIGGITFIILSIVFIKLLKDYKFLNKAQEVKKLIEETDSSDGRMEMEIELRINELRVLAKSKGQKAVVEELFEAFNVKYQH